MKKRLLSMLLALSMAATAMPMLSLTARAEGTGTAEDPYLIYTAAELAEFRDKVNAGEVTACAKLMNDIDLSSISNWVPIAQTNGYKGTFDGTGFTIKNLKINTATTDNIGLFGVLEGGTVKSLALDKASVVNTFSMNETTSKTITIPEGYAKIISRQDWYDKHPNGIISTVGQIYTRSNNTQYNFNVPTNSNYVPYAYSYYTTSTATIFGNYRYLDKMNRASTVSGNFGYTKSEVQLTAGGIAAVMERGLIERCSFTGTVNAPYARAGGLVGWQKGGKISRSYSTGSVLGTYAGGAVGVVDGGEVENCYSTAAGTAYSKTLKIYSNSNVEDYVTGRSYRQHMGSYTLIGGKEKKHVLYYTSDCYEIEVHSYRWNNTASDVNVHPGYTSGFANDVNGGTIKNCYYYNKSAVGKEFSDNNTLAASTYNLATKHASSATSASLTAAEYTVQSNFDDWDFQDIWAMDTTLGRPVLYYAAGAEGVTPKLVLPTGDDAIIKVIADYPRSTSANLADYVKLSSGASTAGRMKYQILSGEEYVTLIGDELLIHAPLSRADYPVTIKGHDTKDGYDDFTFELIIRAVTKVKEPVAQESGFEYSREKTLSTIGITEGWAWVDGTIVPINDFDEGYDAVYSFGDEESYMFDWSDAPSATYDKETNSLKAKVPIVVLRSAESPWATYITVRNADTGEVVEGAEVSHLHEFEFPQGNKTGKDGRVYAELSMGEQTLTVAKDGFDTKEETVTIRPTNGNEVEIVITPERIPFTMPKVCLRDGTVIDNARVTLTRTSSTAAAAWNSGANSAEYDAQSEQKIPTGEYKFVNATYGYSNNYSVYASVYADGTIEYYKDASHSQALTAETFIIYVEKSDDPTYHVYIDRENRESKEYTVLVTLENIAATYGTFGLRYDTSMFSLDESSVTMADGLELQFTPAEMYGGDWDTSDGYYLMVWQAGGYDDTVFDTTGGPQRVCTMTFTLNDGADPDLITLDTFNVQPWNEVKPAVDFAKTLPKDNANFEVRKYYSEYWRYYDEDNARSTLKPGRLEASKAMVNGVDTLGFYQAAVNSGLGSDTPYYFNDVRTLIDYGFDVNNSVIKFHVIDKDTRENIQGAAVRVYGTDGAFYGLRTSDSVGRASLAVSTANTGTDFAYTAICDGYYPVPESGFIEDRPTFEAEKGKATEILIELEKRVYHVPKIAQYNELQIIEDATLGGERYGYNGRDFHFRIKGAAGRRITRYPTSATVTVGEDTITVPYEKETGLCDIPGSFLNQSPLTVEEMNDLEYENVIDPQPDKNGWRSYDMIIQFNDFAVDEINYDVTAYTNEHGSVTYTATDPFDDGLLPTVDETHKKVIRTLTSKDTGGPNNHTGTFHFMAEDGYKVEKVYINGLQIHTYDDRDHFDYTFGAVDTDNNITVLFYNGTEPSKDTVMTLVVGEYGSVNITSPLPGETDVTQTRRTYLNPTENLTFTAEGIAGYKLCAIEVETNTEPRTAIDIEPDDPTYSYTFEPPDTGGNKTVYVTFKEQNHDRTPTVFVKSYVESGYGTITPCGIQIYNFYDMPEFTLEADEGDWQAKGVLISPYNLSTEGKEYDFEERQKTNSYIMEPLKTDTAIGAIFTERGYILTGYVDLGQGSNVTKANPLSGALVTFTRTDEEGNEIPNSYVYKARTTASRQNAAFTIELPEGTWTVTVTKPGYVKYKITKFPFSKPEDADAVTYFGSVGGEVKKITPYIGSSHTGASVSLIDAATVKSGMRDGASAAAMEMADVDNDGKPNSHDMIYVLFNYGQRTVTEEYADFLTSDYPAAPH